MTEWKTFTFIQIKGKILQQVQNQKFVVLYGLVCLRETF